MDTPFAIPLEFPALNLLVGGVDSTHRFRVDDVAMVTSRWGHCLLEVDLSGLQRGEQLPTPGHQRLETVGK